MKVKCIDNYLMSHYLTVGKVYNVELNENRGYTILDDTNDCGQIAKYPKSYFHVVIK